jgi:hypothetical protein
VAPNLQAWMEVLAKMEAEADAAFRMDLVSGEFATRFVDAAGIAASGSPEAGEAEASAAGIPWTPPANLGPVPDELVERARDVEAAQRAAVEHLEAAKATTARHLIAVQSVPEGRTSGRAVFLDVIG